MNDYFTEMCSGSEAGSYLRLIDFLYHSTLGLRVIKKKKKTHHAVLGEASVVHENVLRFCLGKMRVCQLKAATKWEKWSG